jgi:hypothetical protein
MSDPILKYKQEVLLKFFNFLRGENTNINITNLDNFEKIAMINKEFKQMENEIIDLINDVTYFSIGKLDIKLNGIDETFINKIVKIIFLIFDSINIK